MSIMLRYRMAGQKINFFRKGFTLIELIVVMSIIGILASIITVSVTSTKIKSRDTKRKSDLTNLVKALEVYSIDSGGSYPTYTGFANADPTSNFHMRFKNAPSGAVQEVKWGEPFEVYNASDVPTLYMGKLPEDPQSGYQYVYGTNANATKFYLYAILENPKDADLRKDGSGNVIQYSGVSCSSTGTGGPYCNYAITSKNNAVAPNTPGDW